MAASGSSAGTSRTRHGASGSSSGRVINTDEESAGIDEGNTDEEDRRCVPPRMQGKHLTVSFPLQVPIACIAGNCKVKVTGDVWTSAVHCFTRHLRTIHKIVPDTRSNMCSLCDTEIGRQPATHACFKNRKLMVQSDETQPFVCTICKKEFPSKKGITNHLKTHQAKTIQQRYNKNMVFR